MLGLLELELLKVDMQLIESENASPRPSVGSVEWRGKKQEESL
jgi:hypothetical protein